MSLDRIVPEDRNRRLPVLFCSLAAVLLVRLSVDPALTPLLLFPTVLGTLWFGRWGGAVVGACALLLAAGADAAHLLEGHSSTVAADLAGVVPYALIGYLVGRMLDARHAEDAREREQLLAHAQEATAAAEREQRRSRMLAAEALEAEQTVRRRISESLHDDAIQTLLAAAQDITEARQGEPESLVRAARALGQTIARLRDAVFELHPVALEQGGVEAALKAIAQHQGQRGRFKARVRVAPEAAGIYDLLIVTIARELLTNVAKHAGATEVLVSVARTASHVFLQVSDDGRGMHPGERRAALERGHIGLASCAERAAAVGGSLDVISGPGEGTVVRVLLPSEGIAESHRFREHLRAPVAEAAARR